MHLRSPRFWGVLALVAMAAAVPATAWASSHTETISEPTVAYSAGNPDVSIVDKDGTGALRIETPEGSDKAQVGVTTLTDTTVSDLESLSYRAMREQGSEVQIASINLPLYDNGTWAGTLVYEPVYNGGSMTGAWQSWDTLDGVWWHTGDPNTFQSWDEFANDSYFGNLTVAGVLVNQGSGNPGLTSYVDWVEVEGTTYDFEPAPEQPESKDDCKQGGWETYGFSNQGQCVRYVNTGQDSR